MSNIQEHIHAFPRINPDVILPMAVPANPNPIPIPYATTFLWDDELISENYDVKNYKPKLIGW